MTINALHRSRGDRWLGVLCGRFAIELREAFRRVSREQLHNMVKEVFASGNLQATGARTTDAIYCRKPKRVRPGGKW